MRKSPSINPAVGRLILTVSLVIPNILYAQDYITDGLIFDIEKQTNEQSAVCPAACGFSIEELDRSLVPAGSDLNPYECLSISRDHFVDGFPAQERGRVLNELNADDKDGNVRGAQVIFSKPPGFDGGICQIYEKGINDPEVTYEKPAPPGPKEKGTTILRQIEGLTLEQVAACHDDIMAYAQARFTSSKDLLCF